eukprot:803564-Pelagomonas_calceolata.AAC.2
MFPAENLASTFARSVQWLTHVSVAVEASPVGQKHEGGNWLGGLKGGMYCVAQESEHNFIIMMIMRGVAEGEAIEAHRGRLRVPQRPGLGSLC